MCRRAGQALAKDERVTSHVQDFTAAVEPFLLFEGWFAEASGTEPNDPNAMALATVDASRHAECAHGAVEGTRCAWQRRDRGFVFYTNLESAKGGELAQHPKAALLFHWKSLRRQVRVRGPVTPVTPAKRPTNTSPPARAVSRIGAWASDQSRPLESRFALEKSVAVHTAKFGIGEIPRPPHWSGFRLTPLEMEFWHDRPFRLHDRVVFRRAAPGDHWTRTRLYP